MTQKTLRYYILADLYRITGSVGLGTLIKTLLFGEGYKYAFWMRIRAFSKRKPSLLPLHCLARLMLRHYQYKLGICIPYTTSIGEGLFIGHFGSIVVNGRSVIGRNCSISHDVTLGKANRGTKKGSPVLGDNVYIGPGAKIIGHVVIGNNVAIGANCVVTKDVPDNAVVVGIPGRVISYEGSFDYVTKTDYERLLSAQSEQEPAPDGLQTVS